MCYKLIVRCMNKDNIINAYIYIEKVFSIMFLMF
nr:MAG TPA: hypothetical protein [Caudoviricetes sp.]